MTEKSKMKDMVVIIPGITGSVLQKNGQDIWAVSGQAIWQALTNLGDTIEQLKIDQDDPDAESLGDGIQATSLIQDTHLIPGLWKIDGYTKTARLITDNFDVTSGNIYTDSNDKPANFYHFPYDWRRDNRASAKLLKKLLDKRLKRWREASGAEDAKVILLAHSMGGLVSRYYLEVLEGWRDCRALFTFGTPYRGSVHAVNFLANGYKMLFGDLTEVLRSFTSVYQLLPIYEMVKIGDNYLRIAEADNLPNIVKSRAEDALKFHREIEDAVNKHRQDETYHNSFKTIPIAGIQQATFQSAEFINGKLTVSEKLPKILQNRPDLADGDGTVPQVSAIPIELSNSFNNSFIAERHSSLQNQNQILEDLKNRIKFNQSDLASVRASQTAISLALDDLYLTDEAIAMRARVISTPGFISGKLHAKITSISHEQPPINLDFHEQEQEWMLTIDDLKPGLYRVSVQTENTSDQAPSPVHDIFEVVKP
ncbi:lipase/acyltransferase domain-containing protein [Capilliphycus salinus ALCB114379]|uniref:lipase/acyltransferase domain-containing protein n=1 Tax=Capilliphycus salinus TaxID=2768948 RepID=UPI0039A594C4